MTDLLERAVADGTLAATCDPAAINRCDAVVIAADTTFDRKRHRPDLGQLEARVRDAGDNLARRALVVVGSTVAPGTCEWILLPELEARSGMRAGADFDLAHCPAGAWAGPQPRDIRTTPRVVGGHTPRAADRAATLYSRVTGADVQTTDLATAEMVELVATARADVNIALANEVALVAQEVGADAFRVLDIVGDLTSTHTHTHTHTLTPTYTPTLTLADLPAPGPGAGGLALTRDGWLLASAAPGYFGSVVREARLVNDGMPAEVARLLEVALAAEGVEPAGATVVVLGLAFPAGSGDTDASPTLGLLRELKRLRVRHRRVVDPRVAALRGVKLHPLEPATFDGADALVLVTPHPEFVEFDYAEVYDRMAHPVVVDACGAFHREYEAMGFRYAGLGRTPTRAREGREPRW